MRIRLDAVLVAGVALVGACSPDDTAPVSPVTQVGRVRFVHAAPDTAKAKTVNVRIDGMPLAANVAYKGVAGYVLAMAGDRQVAVRRTSDTSIVVLDQTVTVAAGGDYTVLATGSGTGIAALVLTDDNTTLSPGHARLRIVNASPVMGAADVYVTAPGTDLSTATPVATSLAFRAATAYVAVTGGAPWQVRFTTPGDTTLLLAVPALTPAAGQVRTFLALDAATGGTPLTSATLTDR